MFPSPLRARLACCLAVCAWFLSGCAAINVFLGKELRVGYGELTERLAKRTPLEKDLAGLVGATLTNPSVFADTAGDRTRLAASFHVELKLPLSNKSLFGTMTLSGVPRFDADKQAIFLTDAKLDRVRIDRMPDALAESLAKFATQFARDQFSEKPIYLLKESDAKRLGDALRRARVEVKPEGLLLIWR